MTRPEPKCEQVTKKENHGAVMMPVYFWNQRVQETNIDGPDIDVQKTQGPAPSQKLIDYCIEASSSYL